MADALRDAVSSASAELNVDRNDAPETKDVPRETVRETPEVHDDDDFDAPKWVKSTWSKKARAAAKQLTAYEGAPDHLKVLYEEMQDKYNDNKSKRDEYNQYRARFSRYENFLPQIEQDFAFRGLDPVTGI